MAVVNSEHLLEQADRLIIPPLAGPPRQADLRRAISAAYYAVFHFILVAASDEFIGGTKQNTARYALVYRSIDHKALTDLCEEAMKVQQRAKYAKFVPASGFGDNIKAFASAVVDLKEKRHGADYDPAIRLKTADAKLAIDKARSAIGRFKKASATRRKAFLTLLAFPPR